MPRITAVTNRCNTCSAVHRGEVDDSDRLADGVEDTALPEFWVEATIRAKQTNPDDYTYETDVKRAVEGQWKIAVQQATAAKGGAPLDSDDVEGLRELLEGQVRQGTEEPPELVVEEIEVILCPKCAARITAIGAKLEELSAAEGIVPAPWAVVAAPAVVATPAPTPPPTPAPLAEVAADQPPRVA